MEFLSLCDENHKPLDVLHPRGSLVPAGAYVLVTEIWTVNSKGELLLTLRHPDKEYGGFWEVTGGAVQAGETTREAAARELFEETGIKAPAEELRYIHERRDDHTISTAICCAATSRRGNWSCRRARPSARGGLRWNS